MRFVTFRGFSWPEILAGNPYDEIPAIHTHLYVKSPDLGYSDALTNRLGTVWKLNLMFTLPSVTQGSASLLVQDMKPICLLRGVKVT